MGPGWREGNNIYSMKGHAGGCEPWVPLGTVTENKAPTTTDGGTGRESTGLSKRKSVLKTPVQLPVWHKGAPNMRKRKIKMGFRRRTLDDLTLRTPVGYSKEDAQWLYGGECRSVLEWSSSDRWESLAGRHCCAIGGSEIAQGESVEREPFSSLLHLMDLCSRAHQELPPLLCFCYPPNFGIFFFT